MTSAVDLFEAELRLCGVHEGETVAVLSQTDRQRAYARDFLAAAQRLGAHSYEVGLPADSEAGGLDYVGVNPLAGNRAAIEALKQADLMVDLVFLLFSVEQQEIQESGTRILLCIESLDVLSRLLPTPELRERVEIAAEIYSGAETLRFTNAHGSDVTYQLGTYPVMTEYGYTDEPGRWDHWPSGFLFSGGRDDGVDGRVVIAPGDIVYPFNRYVQSPVELTVESGRIADIRGGLDADLMADYMAGFKDEKAYGISTHRLGPQRALPLVGPGNRPAEHRHGGTGLLRQRAVLHRPEPGAGRQQRHRLPLRHPYAELLPLPRRRADRRRRRRRRTGDAPPLQLLAAPTSPSKNRLHAYTDRLG